MAATIAPTAAVTPRRAGSNGSGEEASDGSDGTQSTANWAVPWRAGVPEPHSDWLRAGCARGPTNGKRPRVGGPVRPLGERQSGGGGCQSPTIANQRRRRRERHRAGAGRAARRGAVTVAAGRLRLFAAGSGPSDNSSGSGGSSSTRYSAAGVPGPRGAIPASCGAALPRVPPRGGGRSAVVLPRPHRPRH